MFAVRCKGHISNSAIHLQVSHPLFGLGEGKTSKKEGKMADKRREGWQGIERVKGRGGRKGDEREGGTECKE